MSRGTLAKLRKRGGNLFVWLDGAGMMHVRPRRPADPVRFESIETDDVVLQVDAEIKPPSRWVIVYTRFPWPHFDAYHDPPPGSLFDAIVDNITWP